MLCLGCRGLLERLERVHGLERKRPVWDLDGCVWNFGMCASRSGGRDGYAQVRCMIIIFAGWWMRNWFSTGFQVSFPWDWCRIFERDRIWDGGWVRATKVPVCMYVSKSQKKGKGRGQEDLKGGSYKRRLNGDLESPRATLIVMCMCLPPAVSKAATVPGYALHARLWPW